MPSPRKVAATFESSAGNFAGEIDAVNLRKTSLSSGNWLVSVSSSGSKKNSDNAVSAGSPALNGCVVAARRHGISIGGSGSSASAIFRSLHRDQDVASRQAWKVTHEPTGVSFCSPERGR